MTKTLGTKEWAPKNLNFSFGCSNNCNYCYARRMAHRFKRIDWNNWHLMKNRMDIANKKFQKIEGLIMTPSSHDITPYNKDIAIQIFRKLLNVGNELLIVSKPNPEVIREIITSLEEYKNQVIIRFSIGTLDDSKRLFWEPGASSIKERIQTLKEVYEQGWETSVSIEPFLDRNVVQLIKIIDKYITQSIWIGPMNRIHVPKELWTKKEQALYSADSLFDLKNEIDLLSNSKIRFKDHFLNKIKIPLSCESSRTLSVKELV